MDGENRNVISPLHRKSCNSTPDIAETFNANQFWSYPFKYTEEDLLPNMNSSFSNSISKADEIENNNDTQPEVISEVENVNDTSTTAPESKKNINENEKKAKPNENNPSNTTKTVIVPKNFNSLNELTEEELLILIEERRKAAAEADIVICNVNNGDFCRKSPVNSEYSSSTKGVGRRVSDTFGKKQDAAPLDLRRKSLPSSKNFLHGFLQSFVLSANKNEVSSDAARQSPNALDLSMKPASVSPEVVREINGCITHMEISPDREELDNTSLNRTPVASGSCKRPIRLSKIAAGTPKEKPDNVENSSEPKSRPHSPELQYPTEKDFGYVSPIPVNEQFNPSLTYSDSPKMKCQSPILSCSFTDPTAQYTSDPSDDSSFEREFDPDLMSFEDPALEKSPFVKYSVELRAKLAARISGGDGPYKPFLFSPRTISNPKVYTAASDRNLHLLREETSLDFENNDTSQLIPEEQSEISVDALKVVGEVTAAAAGNDPIVIPQCLNISDEKVEEQPHLVSVGKNGLRKTVWSQLVENIEMHIVKGNKAGFIASLNGHSLPCV